MNPEHIRVVLFVDEFDAEGGGPYEAPMHPVYMRVSLWLERSGITVVGAFPEK
jgi:hypothetical protein